MGVEYPDHLMRASDADREAVVERLRTALGEGRLTITEFDERVRDAYAAITQGQLVPLTADLPASVPARRPSAADRREYERKKLVREWRDWAGMTLVLILIWAVTSVLSGGLNPFWPVIPMGIWALIIVLGMIFDDESDDESDDDSDTASDDSDTASDDGDEGGSTPTDGR
jgi:hypothetical protein